MYERFLELLEEKGVKTAAVAKETNIHPSTFSDWKKGKSSPKLDKLHKIADYFGVNVDWISGKSDFKTFDDFALIQSQVQEYEEGSFRIPVLGEVAAGEPIFVQEHYIGYENVPTATAKRGHLFGLIIKGNSMSPRIAEGDTVIVRQQDDAETGDIVIVSVNGEYATCKRLMKYAEGISLISFNPEYKPITFTNEEIETIPVKIIGKVIENRQKY
ncbi:XRE family transcriptional regulator [bacterium D16-51]|nr:XRE family transcriptional regulator [bacterium D16-59]RKI60262.1 XRE family transcriptional regulator [bacterium D16-51]